MDAVKKDKEKIVEPFPFTVESERLFADKKNPQESIDNVIANSLDFLVHKLSEITEFNAREIISISMLSNHDYISPYLEVYLLNKKHIKRKHSKELLEAISKISAMIKIGGYDTNDYYPEKRRFRR